MSHSRIRLLVGITVPVLLATLFGACGRKPQAVELSSLSRSGASSFFCMGPGGTPAPLIDCPLGDLTSSGALSIRRPDYALHALVTQTLTAEVAVIRVANQDSVGGLSAKVLDVDPSNPGVTPLRIGGQPTDVVTTPGGRASFVTVAEPGKEGVFALPTQCVFAPGADETRRDLTTWPACRLPSAPGAMVMLVDPEEGREFCSGGPSNEASYADDDAECRVDLGQETYRPGRRKLVVSLPREGKLVVLDAQELLDREQGSYDDCLIDAELPLNAEFPAGLSQPLPSDLQSDDRVDVSYPLLEGSYSARPVGMDLRDDLLAVADLGAPLVHLLDVADPCAVEELPALYATSYASPDRVVVTSEVAISPVTEAGEQFVYAVDTLGDELASLVPFDISTSSASRFPLLRSGSALLPFEAPDRIQFNAAVKDVAFAQLDRPISDGVLGQSVSKVSCDPDPQVSEDALSAQYRPGSGSIGAAPAVLRGTFAYALLSDGRMSVVDVEDYDAACRRPVSLNTGDEMDHRGCVSDPDDIEFYTQDETETGVPTVSDETSCRVVVPHRARSARFVETVEGASIQAPSLRAHPRLSRYGRGLTISRLTPEGKKNPILLGADFADSKGRRLAPAQVHVGSKLYVAGEGNDPLIVDPNLAERAAPVLPYYEPRAYPSSEVVTVSYEGDIDRTRSGGDLEEPSEGISRFEDHIQGFCDRGVQGRRLTEEMGSDRFELEGGALERFVERHTDYLQVANLLLDESDPYWDGEGATCGEGFNRQSGTGYDLCDSVFRVGDGEELAPERDLSIVEAHDDYLLVTPRGLTDSDEADSTLELMRCCFPTQLKYRLRAGHQWVVRGEASGFQHPIVSDEQDPEGACKYDDSPLAEFLWGRAFEVSNNNCQITDPEAEGACGVGPRTVDDVVCSYDGSQGPVGLNGLATPCIFNSLTRRFVVYRGLEPTVRNTTFAMEVIGGFESMGISISSNSTNVLPVSISRAGDLPVFGVVDSQNNGFSVVDLLSSRVAQNFY